MEPTSNALIALFALLFAGFQWRHNRGVVRCQERGHSLGTLLRVTNDSSATILIENVYLQLRRRSVLQRLIKGRQVDQANINSIVRIDYNGVPPKGQDKVSGLPVEVSAYGGISLEVPSHRKFLIGARTLISIASVLNQYDSKQERWQYRFYVELSGHPNRKAASRWDPPNFHPDVSGKDRLLNAMTGEDV